MRLDPNALGTVLAFVIVAVVASTAASVVSSSSVALAIMSGAGALSLVLIVRALRRATGAISGERLRTSLPDEMLAALSAPSPQLAAVEATRVAEPVVVPGTCPRCRTPLAEAAGTFHERECPQRCGALVIDSERLLVDRAGLDLELVRALVREQGVQKAACPSCTTAMHEGRLRGLVVDLCLSCGALWLDKDELHVLSRERAFGGGT